MLNSAENENRITVLERRLGLLEGQVNTQTESIQVLNEKKEVKPVIGHFNYLRCSTFDLSRNDFLYYEDVTGTAGVDADVSEECFDWYTSDKDPTVLIEDSTDVDVDANPATNTTLKTVDHTLYAADDPYWDKDNGWVVISSDRWLVQPLKQNVIKPSIQYIVSFMYKLSTGTQNVDFICGIWDNTDGQRKFLEASQEIQITAEVIGSPGSTVSTDYFIIFTTNWGQTVGSNVVTVDAPVTFSSTEYVALEWDQPAGMIRTDIYRKVGSNVYRLNPPYPQSSYKDKGAYRGAVLGAFPTPDISKSRAYFETNSFNIADATDARWLTAQFNIPVPKKYNAGLTTDKQWFVIGLKTPLTGAELYIQRLSLDDKPGVFSRSPWDAEAKRSISSHPTEGDVGGIGGGGDPIDPGDTGFCPAFMTPVDVEIFGKRHRVPAIELVNNERLYRIINLDGIPVEYEASVSPTKRWCRRVITLNHDFSGSEDHPIFIDERMNAKQAQELAVGDEIITHTGPEKIISNLREVLPQYVVKITLKGPQKGFWAGGIGGHNAKGEPTLP